VRQLFRSLFASDTATAGHADEPEHHGATSCGREAALTAALGHIPMFLFSQDTDLRYGWLHSTHEAIRAADLLGRTDAEILDGPDATEVRALKRQVLETGISI